MKMASEMSNYKGVFEVMAREYTCNFSWGGGGGGGFGGGGGAPRPGAAPAAARRAHGEASPQRGSLGGSEAYGARALSSFELTRAHWLRFHPRTGMPVCQNSILGGEHQSRQFGCRKMHPIGKVILVSAQRPTSVNDRSINLN